MVEGREEREALMELTHFDEMGNARMVDVSEKGVSRREAAAQGTICVSREVMEKVKDHAVKKGDVLTVAQVAGIMGSKRTADLIPMCHPLSLAHVSVTFSVDEKAGEITALCTVVTEGKTGVEMEALTGGSAALLTIYDMCKAIDRAMVIRDIHLVSKSGGKSGNFRFL